MRFQGSKWSKHVQVSNKTLQVLSSGSEDDAWTLATELRELRTYLEEEKDVKSSRFLRVMEGLLAHTVLKEANQLDGMYQRALDTILNQVLVCATRSPISEVNTHPTKRAAWQEHLKGTREAEQRLTTEPLAVRPSSHWSVLIPASLCLSSFLVRSLVVCRR